jgi:D-glycero-D-manno-heptose 1,7-bisphosphate phosphatase
MLTPGLGLALGALASAGYRLVLISNQPNLAKGKCSRAMLDRIHERLVELLAAEGVSLDAAYYCYHHPDHTGSCRCRKPKPAFLHQAAARFHLDLKTCWMMGDRASDVLCGRAAGSRTIWIDAREGEPAPENGAADVVACSVPEAVSYILACL